MTPQPVALPTGSALATPFNPEHGSAAVALARGAAKTMNTVQQRSVKATFFRVVRAVAGIRSLSIGNALFSFVRVRRSAVIHSLPGEFSAYAKQKA